MGLFETAFEVDSFHSFPLKMYLQIKACLRDLALQTTKKQSLHGPVPNLRVKKHGNAPCSAKFAGNI